MIKFRYDERIRCGGMGEEWVLSLKEFGGVCGKVKDKCIIKVDS